MAGAAGGVNPQLPGTTPGLGAPGIGQSSAISSGIPPDLARLLKTSVTQFVSTNIRPVVETDKVVWNAQLRRNERYYRGQQYLSYGATGPGLVDYQPVSNMGNLQLSNAGSSQELYDYILNFFQGDVDTFIAVIGARSPNGQAQARDLSNEQQVRLKLKADRVNSYLESHWNVDLLHPQLVRGLALYGTMFGYTRFTISQQKFGITHEPQYSIQNIPLGGPYYQCHVCGTDTPAEQAQAQAAATPGLPPLTAPCSRCGTPLGPESLIQPDSVPSLVPNGTIPYANGAVELSILNPAHITVPTWVPDLDHAPWLIYETEDDKGSLVHAYPELREKAYQETYYLDGSAASATGRWTRELLTSLSGYQVPRSKARWLHTRMWFAPTCYEYLPGDQSGQLREYLLDSYPDGFRVPMVNGELLIGGQDSKGTPRPNRLMNERLTSVWAACKPKPSETIYADPYFECMIQATDTINDSVSMIIEQAERSNPFVIADPEILDPAMLREYANVPGEFKFAKPGSVGTLDKGFFRVPAAEMNPVLIQFIDKYLGWCREITGITPALFGGGDQGPQKTAHQYEIMKNQAMMKLGVPWKQVRSFWAQTRENGIYQAARYSGGQLFSVDTRGIIGNEQMDGIWELLQGGWFIETEENMPQSIGQRRDFFMNALTNMQPEAREQLGLSEPNNVVKLQEAVGMSDWETPNYKQILRLHDIIGQLAQAEPMPGLPGPPDPMTGMPGPPGPPQPSIPFDGFLFDPTLALKVVKSYLWNKGADMEQSNPAGLANITAYGHAASDALGPQAPPPPPPRLSFTASLADLTPPAQEAVFKYEGIPIDPGTLIALPKPEPMPPGAGPGGPPGGKPPIEHSQGPEAPPPPEANPLAGPAPGAGPPPPQMGGPPGGIQ
jgi:hypothetical protein